MNFLKGIWAKLAGWKVYILGVGAILTLVGNYMSGTIDLHTLEAGIWMALVSMAQRHAITTTVSSATGKTL